MPKSRREPVALTDFKVRALKADPTGAEYIQGDREVGGLGVRVRPNGAKSYVVMKRLPGQAKLVRVTLGRVGEISLAQARDQARQAIRATKLGVNVNREKRGERQRQREAIAATGYPAGSFGEAAEQYVASEDCKQLVRARETELLIRRHLIDAWGNRRLADIRQSDLWEILDPIIAEGHHRTAHRVRQIAVGLFYRSVERGAIDANFIARGGGRRGLIQIRPRERVLNDDEIRRIWHACDDGVGWPYADFIRLSLLLGQRRGEIARMERGELDLDRALWTIPASRMKGGITHAVPLPPAAVAIIRDAPKVCERYVLATAPGQAIAAFVRPKRRLDAASGVTGWVVHDLRRTVRTGLAALRIDSDVAERVIGHVIGGVRGVYDCHAYLDEKRDALERWARRLEGIVNPPPDNVVTLVTAAR
jgi:integrase